MVMLEGESRDCPDRRKAGKPCTHYRDTSLANSLPLFSGSQDMQVLRITVLGDGMLVCLCVYGFLVFHFVFLK